MRCHAPLFTAIMIGACHAGASQPGPQPQAASSRFLFVWAGDADRRDSDFLAVIDVDPRSPSYASVVATLPVGRTGTRPHHTEHEMPASGVLWANGFDAGQTFRFDLRDPTRPHLVGSVADAGPFRHPHSYARLPNGNILATFQRHAGSGHTQTGGLVEFDPDGLVITGYRELESRVLLAQVDRATGALRLDTTFRTSGAQAGVEFGRERWPHGRTGRAIPHGAVFSRP